MPTPVSPRATRESRATLSCSSSASIHRSISSARGTADVCGAPSTAAPTRSWFPLDRHGDDDIGAFRMDDPHEGTASRSSAISKPTSGSCSGDSMPRCARRSRRATANGRSAGLCADSTGSRNDSRRSGCSCCRAFPASALRAHRLLCHCGSVERIFTADAVAPVKVRGIGEKKAARIRELVR